MLWDLKKLVNSVVLGWNIFPYIASVAIVLSASGAGIALRHKERSTAATLLSVLAIVVMAVFVALLWHTLGRPPLRTMGETRLWYSLFMLVAGAATYHRWHYRWILSFSTLMATVFILINILRPEIHDESLMPALQSAWFIPHVSVYMFSYSLLGCATLLAICGIAKSKLELRDVVEKLLYGGIGLFTVGGRNMGPIPTCHTPPRTPNTTFKRGILPNCHRRLLVATDVLVWRKLSPFGKRECTHI